MKSGGTVPHPCVTASPLSLEELPLSRVSKDEAASWFETRKDALLTMRIEIMLERDDFSSNRHPALSFCLRMIFSENRYPLFRIML